jgi:hypothetical protein
MRQSNLIRGPRGKLIRGRRSNLNGGRGNLNGGLRSDLIDGLRGEAQPQLSHRDLSPQSPDMPHSCGAVLRSSLAVTALPGESRLAQARWQG